MAHKGYERALGLMGDLGWHCMNCMQRSHNIKTGAGDHVWKTFKSNGYKVEIKREVCGHCSISGNTRKVVFRRLCSLSRDMECDNNLRNVIDSARVKRLLGTRDNFTGASTTDPRVDHRIGAVMMTEKEKTFAEMTDDEVCDKYQILSENNNYVKREKCNECKKTGIRPGFMQIPFWYVGDAYTSGCDGCGWAYPEKWRAALQLKIV